MQLKKISRREFVSGLGAVLAASGTKLPSVRQPDLVPAKAEFGYAPQSPTDIPILPGINIGRSFPFPDDSGPCGTGARYEPARGGGFAIINGPGTYNHILTGDGVWYVLAGDEPRLRLIHRTDEGSYAEPGILPGLGVGGSLRLAVTHKGESKWLDQVGSIHTRFAPGIASWKCDDEVLGLSLELEARPLVGVNGFIATASAHGDSTHALELTWAFGAIRDKNNRVELANDFARLSNPDLEYTEILVGLGEGECEPAHGDSQILRDSNALPTVRSATADPCALFSVRLRSDLHPQVRNEFLCVWGYTDYDRKGVSDARARLEGRPFADAAWAEEMKKEWFHHWVGRGLSPQRKFFAVRSHVGSAAQESKAFWDIGKRIRIKTPDARFDNVVNNAAADLRQQFEYPAFIHGLVGWSKYGKISCGYYGAEAAGYHDEVESSLKFISGTQDQNGRQRYFTPAFAISDWAEEQDFYYAEHVYYHYRWTGSRDFLKQMWPSVRRSLDHALAVNDPDGDGLMTGYYEFWNNDMHSRGGRCVVQTAMAWTALRSATEIARRLGENDCAGQYEALASKVKEQLRRSLWNRQLGAFGSAETNCTLRPHPEAQEQFLPISRGVSDSMEAYMAMRYVRDTLFLNPQAGVTLELMNDWWPIGWSHHYVANGDTALSVLAACRAGDVDHFWPALKTISESAYRSDDATLCHTQCNDGTGAGMKSIAELQGPFIQAVAEGVFGLEPEFGENLLVLRPTFPGGWEHAEVATPDLLYSFRRSGQQISIDCHTPISRQVRLEFPVRAQIKEVRINGTNAPCRLAVAVNSARLMATSGLGTTHRFVIEMGTAPTIEGRTQVIEAQTCRFSVQNATARRVLDPQGGIRGAAIRRRPDGATDVTLIPVKSGRCTAFIEIECGQTRYLHPLDLEVLKPWSIVSSYVPAFRAGGPAVSSPRVDAEKRALLIEIQNNREKKLVGPATIRLAGRMFRENVSIPEAQKRTIQLATGNLWTELSPGTIPITVELAGLADSCEAVNWNIGRSSFVSRLTKLDLGPYHNCDLRTLYSYGAFKWRLDYVGCGVGVDHRNPMPQKDELGYVLEAAPTSLLTWGCLPEQRDCARQPRWEVPDLEGEIHTPFGVSFLTDAETNLLALVNTRCSKPLPTSAILRLETPRRLERLYLLTANLTKTVKCYYPAAEVIVHYADGTRLVKQLIPPYTMSCMAQHFSPYCYAIPFGKLEQSPVIPQPQSPNLAVSDVVLDATKNVSGLEFRCVASETIFGILGVTLLTASDRSVLSKRLQPSVSGLIGDSQK
ncbi:MAG TPA: DUF4450 domain-containing protein [Terriglobia bacterium]|nr:DUF4450 domain-containing protein [Terriglobia bacterium]